MGTYASRSTPVAGAAVAMVSRKVRAKARKLAAHLLEVSEEDVEWELGRFYVRSAPDHGVTIQECAMAAYSNMPDGMEPGLENNAYYDPPNLTWPFACYIATVEVDPETGVWDVLSVVAVDDCGVRINPMIVEGQIMGGLTEAYAMASMQFITFDADGNCIGSNFMDYLLPTAWETPGFELHEVVTPCPHHPIGAKGIGECATVGGPAAFVNAVMDAIKGTGVRNIDMPLLPDRVHEALTQRHDVSGAPPVRTTTDGRGPVADGWDVLEQAGELARRGRGVRAGHRRLAAGAVVRAAGLPGHRHRRRRGPRLDRRRLRRAGRDPRGPAGDRGRASRGCCCSARPSSSGAVPEGMTRHPDRLPERGRRWRSTSSRWSQPAPGRRRALADGPHAGRPRRALGWRAELVDAAELRREPIATPDPWSWSRRRATATRRPSSTPSPAGPAFVGLVASRKRGEAVLGYLAERGVPKERLDRVRVPVGLDLGHTSHREIAVADPRRAGAAACRRALVPEAPTGPTPPRRRPSRPRRSTRCAG